MSQCTPEQLRFPPVEGLTVRADFDGGALSSDFGPLLLRGVDQQIGLTRRLAEVFDDRRHPAYTRHSVPALFAQRIYQIACGYEDGNDANALRGDPLFKLGLERKPLDTDADLASAPTFSRWENAASAKDIYRMAQAFVDQFIASYPKAPALIVLDMDPSEDATYGQQELSFYNHHYRSDCYLPLFLFEGLSGKFITAALRPGKRPAGAENAMILKRVVKRLRTVWPETYIVLRGDGHFANPELMQLALEAPRTDFIFGLSGNRVLLRLAEPFLDPTRRGHERRCENARRSGLPGPPSTRTYHELDYAAGSWPQSFRVILKAEVMGRQPPLCGYLPESTRPRLPLPRSLLRSRPRRKFHQNAQERSGRRSHLRPPLLGQPSAPILLLCRLCAATEALRTEVLVHTELAKAQPATVILKLFKLAARVVQYKDRVKLQLPSHCPVKSLLHTVTEILFQARLSALDTS